MGIRGIGFLKTKPPKGFDYKPRYYNEREERMKELRGEMNQTDDAKVKMSRQWGRLRSQQRPIGTSSLRLFMIMIALGLLTYWLLFA